MKQTDIKRLEKSIKEKLKKQDLLNNSRTYNHIYDYAHIDFVDLLDTSNSLTNTCSMRELSFNDSYLRFSYFSQLTKKEFEYILFCSNTRCVITNVVNNNLNDKYLKLLGYEPLSSYRGNEGTINTYIFVNPQYKPKVRKTSK